MDREVQIAQELVSMSRQLEQDYPEATNLQTYMALEDFKKKYPDWNEIRERVFEIAKNLYSKQS